MLTPESLLQHRDSGQIWPQSPGANTDTGINLPAAYQSALAVRRLRIGRGELARGYKIGFTNRGIWHRYQVFAPIWGTVYDTTLRLCEGQGVVSLARCCQPRLEPETVFGIKATPARHATLEDVFEAIDWVAPGFEVVQSHLPDWKFTAPETVADGGLHASLLVGARRPVREVAPDAGRLDALLAAASVRLLKGEQLIDEGRGANVLDSPLRALHYFLTELRQCPGAPDLMPGDVVTTGTWTDAWPVLSGDVWTGDFSSPLSVLRIEFN